MTYNPEQNGIEDRIKRTIIDGEREIIETANIQAAYLPLAILYVSYKHIFLENSTTGKSPLHT